MIAVIIILLVLLVISITVTVVLFYMCNNKLNYYKTVSKDMSSMIVIQKMFQIMGTDISAKDKLTELNDIIIKSYNSKYSTIVTFDGNNYEIKATNVESTYLDSILTFAEESDFKSNVNKDISKYITTSPDKTLTYKSAIERKLKSALFSPIYFNNMYLGFWMLEDDRENAYDEISKVELSKLKENMGVFIENVDFQNTIEIAQNTDVQTGFFNTMYLYSNVRKILNDYENSTLIFMSLKNLPQINDKYGRQIGDDLFKKIANVTKETLAGDVIVIRYSGLKLLIISPGSTAENSQPLCERLLSKCNSEIIYLDNDNIKVDMCFLCHTFKKQNNIEKEIQKMEQFMNNIKEVNTIKII